MEDLNKPSKRVKKLPDSEQDELKFVPESVVPAAEAKKRWPHRYCSKRKSEPKSSSTADFGGEEILQARCHYTEAIVDGYVIKIFEDAYIKADDGKPDYIAKIIELFETIDKEQYLTAQWFYRAEDTFIENHANFVDDRRVFLSDVKDDNPLGSIVWKVKIAHITTNMSNEEKKRLKESSELYCDMNYFSPYRTFKNLVYAPLDCGNDADSSSTISTDDGVKEALADISSISDKETSVRDKSQGDMTLLDLYSGCGAMSTGLCLGASLSGSKLVTKWAVDINQYACESLGKNHPETKVRNEAAEDFLSLLKEWEKLCNDFVFSNSPVTEETNDDGDGDDSSDLSPEEFEVEELLDICFGDPNFIRKQGLYFKVRWKGYGPSEDTWEPFDGLSGCEERIKEFVVRGYQSKILPLPGTVDFICGGPPCQGISGFNRFRKTEDPLKDTKNQQLIVFMDIIDHLKPKYVLMENVVDILKFSDGFLGRYALGRLVGMNYQTRLGIMAAGSYGLPQFRLRVFLWGAQTSEKLPQYPLPTHEVVARGGVPNDFKDCYVPHGQTNCPLLEKALVLEDAIKDLPPATNNEDQEERPYEGAALSEFQKYIRLKRDEILHFSSLAEVAPDPILYDHQPLQLNEDDYERVCQIPKKKGSNFRDLAGVLVNSKNRSELDPSVDRVLLPSKKPLVPEYAIKFVEGRSKKPFGRLWWDETVSTVVTRAEPHNQAILHPEQDRVLTIRENARLQGFLDCYKLYGPIKERYIQVGNAVAIPVALALGYAFGKASQGLVDDNPLTSLPIKFPQCLARI